VMAVFKWRQSFDAFLRQLRRRNWAVRLRTNVPVRGHGSGTEPALVDSL
jgi:hypothetical protein